eukprot:11617826-Prorocentrum_lima.AAC.1
MVAGNDTLLGLFFRMASLALLWLGSVHGSPRCARRRPPSNGGLHRRVLRVAPTMPFMMVITDMFSP